MVASRGSRRVHCPPSRTRSASHRSTSRPLGTRTSEYGLDVAFVVLRLPRSTRAHGRFLDSCYLNPRTRRCSTRPDDDGIDTATPRTPSCRVAASSVHSDLRDAVGVSQGLLTRRARSLRRRGGSRSGLVVRENSPLPTHREDGCIAGRQPVYSTLERFSSRKASVPPILLVLTWSVGRCPSPRPLDAVGLLSERSSAGSIGSRLYAPYRSSLGVTHVARSAGRRPLCASPTRVYRCSLYRSVSRRVVARRRTLVGRSGSTEFGRWFPLPSRVRPRPL